MLRAGTPARGGDTAKFGFSIVLYLHRPFLFGEIRWDKDSNFSPNPLIPDSSRKCTNNSL